MNSLLSRSRKATTTVETQNDTAGPAKSSFPTTVDTRTSSPSRTRTTIRSPFRHVCAALCNFYENPHRCICRACKTIVRRITCATSPLDNRNSKTARMLRRRNTEEEMEKETGTEVSSPFRSEDIPGPFNSGRSRGSDAFGSGRCYGTFPSGRPTPRTTILSNRERPRSEREGEQTGEKQNPWDVPDYWH
jgi:hypothetical protein